MKTYKLPFQKVVNPINYNMLTKLKAFETFTYKVSDSQMLKRLDFGEAYEILDELKSGETVEVKG